ncbi:MAG: DMT family transporter [Acetobacteraceae bacterium]
MSACLELAVPAPRRWLPNPHSEVFGIACGATLAFGAAVSFAVARAGLLGGLVTLDLILVRFLVAGIVLFPVLLRAGLWTLGGIGWARGLVLLVTGGPLFALLQTGGYAYAPLAHGAVIAPAAVTIFSTAIAAAFLRERLTRAHIAGAALVITGIVLISAHGLRTEAGGQAWIGDLMFLASSILWAGFTVLVRYWQLNAVRAIAAMSLLSLLVMLPLYGATLGFGRLLVVPVGALALQGLVQGGLQGSIAVVAYSHSIRVLGVSKAVLFPSIVPAISVLIGIPLLGEIPDSVQIGGLILVTIGLLAAVGVTGRGGRRKHVTLYVTKEGHDDA